MKRLHTYILILICVCISFESRAQYNPNTVCHIDDNRIIFKLDRRWTLKQRKEIEKLFDLDSVLLAAAFKGSREIVLDGVKWEIKNTGRNSVELSKEMNNTPAQHVSTKDIFIFDDLQTNLTNVQTQASATFGCNNFKQSWILEYKNNIARLFLPGHPKARKIYISGTFNNWITNQIPLRQTPSGWMVSIKLQPGKYLYKYIIDGDWADDSNNKLYEDDLNGGKNSVLYCPNYQFELKNHTEARKVMLAGSFNDWKTDELKMNPTPQGWVLPVYIKDGTYTYKFIVDNNWITDPSNKNTRSDGGGNINSVIGIGKSYLFQLNRFTSAKRVVLTGDFNYWNPDELPMEKTAQGWSLSYVLASGNWRYNFIVDGNWITDPANLFITGSGKKLNSVIAFKANHVFTLAKYPNAKRVAVSGNFNDWKEEGYQMVNKNGVWTIPIYLEPGKHLYKFIVDGRWILDPFNKLWEPNQYGTDNSVIWTEP